MREKEREETQAEICFGSQQKNLKGMKNDRFL